jgi:chromosome segregation ATPase
MVEQIVYFTLGFAICGLIGLAFLPLVSARARRLTLARIEARLPMTFDEIEAERDLLRARFAVEKRALEMDAEQARTERAASSAELGRRAVAVMRAQEHLQQTESLLRERDGQLAKSLEFGEKTRAELLDTQAALAERQAELTQKNSDYDVLAEAREKLEQRAAALEASLASAQSDLLDTRGKWETAEAARRENLERAEGLAEQVKTLMASLKEVERRNAEFEARRVRLLAKIAAERGRADELENVNLSMRRIIAEKTAQAASLAGAPAIEDATAGGEIAGAAEGQHAGGAPFHFSPDKDMLDLREAIARIGRQVAQLDMAQLDAAHLDAATD